MFCVPIIKKKKITPINISNFAEFSNKHKLVKDKMDVRLFHNCIIKNI